MAKPPFRIEINSREVRNALRRVDVKLPRELRKVNKEAADMVARATQPEIPTVTGRLKKSTRAQATTTTAAVKSGSPARTPYAGPIHFGWPKHNIEPNEYIYRGLKKVEKKVIKLYERGIAKLMRRSGLKVKIN